MSWFSSSDPSEIDSLVSKATSESIPNGDIDFATALEISDLIRSKRVPSKVAMRSLKKPFLGTKNPNQQRSALKLIDFCIKNGGEHFLVDIASKEFMDPLIGILHDKSLNTEVKEYLLALIQSWSIMFSTHSNLSYVNEVYKKLQDEKFQFPEITQNIDSSLIESKVAPEWQDSDACMLCSKLFTVFNRKHHCRSCGGVFCQEHSSKSCELPELGITFPVRVCDNCYQEHMDKLEKERKSSKKSRSQKRAKASGLSTGDEDADLKKAIALSLQDTQIPVKETTKPKYQDEDEAMKAAIAASLEDIHETPAVKTTEKPANNFYSNILPSQDNNDNTAQYDSLPPLPPPSYEQANDTNITGNEEADAITFVKQVNEYMKTPASERTPISQNEGLRDLYGKVMNTRTKASSLANERKEQLDSYQELYSKIFTIEKLYDEILRARLQPKVERGSSVSMSPMQSPIQAPVQYPTSLSSYTSYTAPQVQGSRQNSVQNNSSRHSSTVFDRPAVPIPTEMKNKPSSPAIEPRGNSISSIGYAPIPTMLDSPGKQNTVKQNQRDTNTKIVSTAPKEVKTEEPINLIDL